MTASGPKFQGPDGASDASGRKWPKIIANHKEYLKQVHGNYLQPLAATRETAGGCKWPQGARGRKWSQMATESG